jgi:Ca-activated chloride channel family protein
LLPADKALVGAFNDKIEFAPSEFTHDRDTLIEALGGLDFGNPTRLYDAIAASMDRLMSLEGRRVVLVFTDGDGLRSDFFNGSRQVRTKPDAGLKRLTKETGGGYFELETTTDLAPTFTRIAHELHSQYVLGFTPAALDGKLHQLTLRVKRPGLTVRARWTYFAAADSN